MAHKIANKPTGYKKLNGSSWITKHKRLAIYLRDGFICNYCGKDLKNENRRNVSLDHIIARSAGGSNKETNLITACGRCNSGRGAKAIEDYASAGAVDRIQVQRYLPLNIALAKALIDGTTGNESEELR